MKRRSTSSFQPRPSQSSSSDDDDEAMEVTHTAVEHAIVIEDMPEVQRKEYNPFNDIDYRGIILLKTRINLINNSAITPSQPVNISSPRAKSQRGAFSGESAEDDVFTQEQNRSLLAANLPTTNLTLNTSATLGKRTKTIKRDQKVSTTYKSSDDEITTTESDIMRRGSAKKQRRKKKAGVTSWLQSDDVNSMNSSIREVTLRNG